MKRLIWGLAAVVLAMVIFWVGPALAQGASSSQGAPRPRVIQVSHRRRHKAHRHGHYKAHAHRSHRHRSV